MNNYAIAVNKIGSGFVVLHCAGRVIKYTISVPPSDKITPTTTDGGNIRLPLYVIKKMFAKAANILKKSRNKKQLSLL